MGITRITFAAQGIAIVLSLVLWVYIPYKYGTPAAGMFFLCTLALIYVLTVRKISQELWDIDVSGRTEQRKKSIYTWTIMSAVLGALGIIYPVLYVFVKDLVWSL